MEIVKKPWGSYQVIYENKKCKVKIITIDPMQAPSYQSHKFRSETYFILEGKAQVTIDDVDYEYSKGDIVFVNYNQKHRSRCISSESLVFVEIQQGTYFGEDDITRYSDDYGRE